MEGEHVSYLCPLDSKPILHLCGSFRTCRVILAPDGTIIVVLAGQPNDATWGTVTENARVALENMRCNFRFAHDDFSHRRGDYWSVTTGFTYGGGQPVRRLSSALLLVLNILKSPANFAHTRHNQEIIDAVRHTPDIRRIANFASGEWYRAPGTRTR